MNTLRRTAALWALLIAICALHTNCASAHTRITKLFSRHHAAPRAASALDSTTLARLHAPSDDVVDTSELPANPNAPSEPVHRDAPLNKRIGRFTALDISLTNVYGSAVAWGDFDKDLDLDILLTGLDANSLPVAKVYRNDGGGYFTDMKANLTGVSLSSIAWGDYDSDGDLDILLTGLDADSAPVSIIYRNNGDGSFQNINAGLTPVSASSVAWGDFNNDGNPDILLTGRDTANTPVTKIYRNDGGGVFTDINANLTGVTFSSVAWCDFDDDGDLDILLTGLDANSVPVTKLYRNEGGGSFTDIDAGLTGVFLSSVAWGDFNNDGNPDILLTGRAGNGAPVAIVYRNEGGGKFTDMSLALTPVDFSSVAWGDYDNDGDLDILITGRDSDNKPVTKLYRNNGGGNFSDVDMGLPAVDFSAVAWGDFDDDGDLDILLTGLNADSYPITAIFRND